MAEILQVENFHIDFWDWHVFHGTFGDITEIQKHCGRLEEDLLLGLVGNTIVIYNLRGLFFKAR
jgi:hypothetical protein